MGKDDDRIGSITDRTPAQRQNLWNMWQTHLQNLDNEMKKTDFDPFQNTTLQKTMALAYHIMGQQSRECSMKYVDYLREHDLADLTKAYKPSLKQIIPIVLEILGAGVAGALGMTPYFKGIPGGSSQASSFSSASQAVNGIFVQGGQGVLSLTNTMQQGEQAKVNFEIEDDKRKRDDHSHARQQQLQAQQRRDDDIRSTEQKKTEAWRQMTSQNA